MLVGGHATAFCHEEVSPIGGARQQGAGRREAPARCPSHPTMSCHGSSRTLHPSIVRRDRWGDRVGMAEEVVPEEVEQAQ